MASLILNKYLHNALLEQKKETNFDEIMWDKSNQIDRVKNKIIFKKGKV